MYRHTCALLCLLGAAGMSQEAVYIPDPNLKAAIEQALWTVDPTAAEMEALVTLSAPELGIRTLVGLEYAASLQGLYLSWNQIADVSPLAGLSALEELDLNNNCCSDLSPLAQLSSLRYLNIHMNGVTDLGFASGLTGLEVLVARRNEVADLSPLAGLDGLVYLDLRDNHISDIGPLSGLSSLKTLILASNQIIDIGPISGLEGLEVLWLSGNQVWDITALGSLQNLRQLYLGDNQISNISALCQLHRLEVLRLECNPLGLEAYQVHLPMIVANNPGISLEYDPLVSRSVTIGCSAGGLVVQPGKGLFEYGQGQVVCLQAQALPGFEFVCWSGSVHSTLPTLLLTIDQDHQLRACFRSLNPVIYVDDDAPSDPDWSDQLVSDPQEDGSQDHPFDSIQEALEVAREGAVVLVRPGVYTGNLEMPDTSVTLRGTDPNDLPVLVASGSGPAIGFCRCTGTVQGLIITGLSGQARAVIECLDALATICNCLVVGNRLFAPGSAILYLANAQVDLSRCTVVDNLYPKDTAYAVQADSSLTVTNSIVWAGGLDQTTTALVYQSLILDQDLEDSGSVEYGGLFVRRGYWAYPEDLQAVADPADPRAVWVHGDYHLVDGGLDIGAYSGPPW